MNLTKALTPKDTEEIKPGLYIQNLYKKVPVLDKNKKKVEKDGKALYEDVVKGYRQIHPAAWEGKINWKNFLLGQSPLKNFIWFAIILFLAWSYFHDIDSYQEFYVEVNSNPAEFCSNVNLVDLNAYGENTITLPDNDG